MREQRFDIVSLRRKKRLPDGRLRADAHVARAGVLDYIQNGKLVREYIPPEELFDPESLETLKGVVFTDAHPPTGLVSSRNAREYQRGMLSDTVRRDGDHIAATIYITDEDLISKMENGQQDVSAGYTCDIEKKAGVTPQGERYDQIQRRRRYNHVASVEFGRAGSARVRMDAAQQVVHQVHQQRKATNMAGKKDDKGVDKALLSAASKISALEAQIAEAEARADAAEGRVDALEAEIDRLRIPNPDLEKVDELAARLETETKRADSAERALASLNDRIKGGVKKRVELENAAREVLGSLDDNGQPTRFDDMTDREIMAVVVEKLHGVSIDDSKSTEYARARFDAAIEGFRAGSAALERIAEEAQRPDVKLRNDAASLRDQYKNDQQNAWMKPLPSSLKKGA